MGLETAYRSTMRLTSRSLAALPLVLLAACSSSSGTIDEAAPADGAASDGAVVDDGSANDGSASDSGSAVDAG